MVKIHMEGGKEQILFDGDPMDVAIEISCAISGVHQALDSQNRNDAEMFKQAMQALLEAESKVWRSKHEITMVVLPGNKKSGAPTVES